MTRPKINWQRLGASAGLLVAVSLWVVNMQLGVALPERQCQGYGSVLGQTSIAAAVLTLASAYVSLRSRWPSRAGRFWSHLNSGLALIFTFALVLQGVAGFMLSGCEK